MQENTFVLEFHHFNFYYRYDNSRNISDIKFGGIHFCSAFKF